MKKLRLFTYSAIGAATLLSLLPNGAAFAQTASGATLNLDEVVVTASPAGRSKMKSSDSVSSMGIESIERAAPTNAADVLRAVPGIRAESTGGEGNANINVRGLPSPDGGARYAQFQENGLPVVLFGDIMFGTADGLMRVDHSLDRVEVVRGGSSAISTSNAPGAIINFIDKTGEEKGGSIAITKGLNFDRTRYDMSYGGALSDSTRFFIGGYQRTGEGVRTAGAGAENGGQIKANITHDLGKGSFVRLNFKSLNDQVPMYLPSPMQRSGDSYSAFPGYDPLTGFSMPKGLVDVASNQYGQKVVTDTSNGAKTKSQSVGGELHLNLDSGWSLNEKFRMTSTSGSWVGMTSPNDVGTAGALAQKYGDGSRYTADVFAGAVKIHSKGDLIGDATAIAKYANGGASATGDTAFIGHLFNVSMKDLGNIVNDLKVSKTFQLGANEKITSTYGLFSMSQNISADWQWSSYLLSMSGANARVINIYTGGSATKVNPNGTGISNGAAAWGDCCVTSYNLKYNQNAPYARWNYESGNLNVDGGIRLENMKASGSAPWGGNPVNYSVTKPTYTLGANLVANNDMSYFGRLSHGVRFNADRVAGGANTATGAVANASQLFDDVDQYEIGMKMRSGKWSTFGTLFMANTRISSFDPTATPQEFARKYKANGFELETGYRDGGFRFAGGLTYTSAKIEADTAASNVGNVPQRQAKMVYQLMPSYNTGDFTFGAAFIGSAASFAGNDNKYTMPAYMLTNAFLSYAIDKKTTFGVTASNLFNKLAITEVQDYASTYFSPRVAAGRAIQASLRHNF